MYYGRPMKPFFMKVPNFWAWVDNSWFITTHFGTVSPFSIFTKKKKPLYLIGIWIWAAKNLGFSHRIRSPCKKTILYPQDNPSGIVWKKMSCIAIVQRVILFHWFAKNVNNLSITSSFLCLSSTANLTINEWIGLDWLCWVSRAGRS
jgi:hypothetical protein